jgi:hypothetical protein
MNSDIMDKINTNKIESSIDNTHFNSVKNSRCVSRKLLVNNECNTVQSKLLPEPCSGNIRASPAISSLRRGNTSQNDILAKTEENMIQQAIKKSLIEENMINHAIIESLNEYNMQNQSVSNNLPIDNINDNVNINNIDHIKKISTKCNTDPILDRYIHLLVDNIVHINHSEQSEQSTQLTQLTQSSDTYLNMSTVNPVFLQKQDLTIDQNNDNLKISNITDINIDINIDEPMDIDEPYQKFSEYNPIDFYLNINNIEQEHYDFIVGRGRNELPDYMNLPINPVFASRNVVFIDCNPNMQADIQQRIEYVDFSWFGICNEQDPHERISVNIIFDWSSFYCGAMQNLKNIVTSIGRRCHIFVPLDSTSNNIPIDISRELQTSIFTIIVKDGRYPLFDWNKDSDISLGINPMTGKRKIISELVNPNKYMIIYAF